MASWLSLYQSSLLLVLLTLAYSYFTSRPTSRDSPSTKGQRVTEVRSWIPLLGHLLSLLKDPDQLIFQISQQCSLGKIFSLSILASRWHIIASRSLSTAILEQPSDIMDPAPVLWSLIRRAFGADKNQHLKFKTIYKDSKTILRGDCLHESLSAATIAQVQSQTPNLVSFSSSLIDQDLWERLSNAESIDLETVGIDFFALIRNFVNFSVLTTLLGTDFMTVYPGILEDLRDLEPAMKYLLLGLPRWFPMPVMAKAASARRRLDNGIDSLHRALDKVAAGEEPDQPWRDLSDVSEIMKERSAVYRKSYAPPALKGPLDLYFVWSMTNTIGPLVFWLLIRILSSPTLLTRIFSEIAPSARASQPPRNFSIVESPSLELDMETLMEFPSLLVASFHECVRLDTSPVFLRKVSEDCTVTDDQDSLFGNNQPSTYALQAGEHIAIPRTLYYQEPSVFGDPRAFRPERFSMMNEKDEGLLAEFDRVAPWLDSKVTGLRQAIIERMVIAFVAGILTLWNFEPSEAEKWEVPEHRTSPNFGEPKKDVRVKVRRRS